MVVAFVQRKMTRTPLKLNSNTAVLTRSRPWRFYQRTFEERIQAVQHGHYPGEPTGLVTPTPYPGSLLPSGGETFTCHFTGKAAQSLFLFASVPPRILTSTSHAHGVPVSPPRSAHVLPIKPILTDSCFSLVFTTTSRACIHHTSLPSRTLTTEIPPLSSTNRPSSTMPVVWNPENEAKVRCTPHFPSLPLP